MLCIRSRRKTGKTESASSGSSSSSSRGGGGITQSFARKSGSQAEEEESGRRRRRAKGKGQSCDPLPFNRSSSGDGAEGGGEGGTGCQPESSTISGDTTRSGKKEGEKCKKSSVQRLDLSLLAKAAAEIE